MLENYLIIHKSILPDYYDKVIEAKRLLESGAAKDVSQAVKMVDISRSTYYKYKDFILEPSTLSGGRNAVVSVLLDHEPGVLSALLTKISEDGGSVLTITQSPPIHDLASVTISLDVSAIPGAAEDFIKRLETVPGVKNPRLIAIE